MSLFVIHTHTHLTSTEIIETSSQSFADLTKFSVNPT